jgi:outer membrane protein, multidrug efflux system
VLDARAYHALGRAEREVGLSRGELAERRRIIAQALVNAMLATLATEKIAELNRVGLRAALARVALAEERARYGSGTVVDVERARQDANAARIPIVSGNEAVLQAREALGLALGSGVATSAPGDLALADFERAVAATCSAHRIVEQRTDVNAARLRAELAERAVDEAWLRFAPSLGLQSQLSWNSKVLYGTQTTWSVRAVLNIPLWDGGARYGMLRDARGAADQARQALTSARLRALVEIAQATRAVGVSDQARSLAEEQQALTARIDEITREGYPRGLGTSLDLVTSAQALRQADINLALATFRQAQARALALLANADCVF